MIELSAASPAAMAALGTVLAEVRGARGEVWVNAALPDGGAARVLLGRDFLLDGELAARIETLPDISNVVLKTFESKLALVG